MNDPGFLTIAAWRTANSKKQTKAEQLCKNYALSKLQPTLYVGRLSFRERKEFGDKMLSLLSGNRDRLHLFASCKSCAMNATANTVIVELYKNKTFEIV